MIVGMADGFLIAEYFRSLELHYPDVMRRSGCPVRILREWSKDENLAREDVRERFVDPEHRTLTTRQNAAGASRPGDLRWLGACRSYKGLINLKTPFDLVLYTSLIWELKPKTIIEFGAMQGGSALWFADQLEALCGGGSEIHSFELLEKCVHPSARHRRLTFHHADLRDLGTLDDALLDRLPHPWLVVDDAHVNLEKLAPYVATKMHLGDYYVWEDMQLDEWATHEAIGRAIKLAKSCGLTVDAKYTDAFGVNVTSSPNGWFRKTA